MQLTKMVCSDHMLCLALEWFTLQPCYNFQLKYAWLLTQIHNTLSHLSNGLLIQSSNECKLIHFF